MFGDRILKAFEGGLLGCFGCRWIGKSEDVLGERQKRILRILRIGTHLEICRGDLWEELRLTGCGCSLYSWLMVFLLTSRARRAQAFSFAIRHKRTRGHKFLRTAGP